MFSVVAFLALLISAFADQKSLTAGNPEKFASDGVSTRVSTRQSPPTDGLSTSNAIPAGLINNLAPAP